MYIRLAPAPPDNYVFLIRDSSGTTFGAVDPGVAEPIVAAVDAAGGRLTHIFLTHHHGDHIGGVGALVARYGAAVIGARADRHRLPPLSVEVEDGDVVAFGADRARVIAVPGHTLGHVAYHFADAAALFCGDALFVLGCGRIFEGTPATAWDSLKRLRALPDETAVYCAHEYAEANARFALSLTPDDPALRARADEIARLRADGRPTVPSTVGRERRTNPFLRADDPAFQAAVGLGGADPADAFADLRKRKDVFRG